MGIFTILRWIALDCFVSLRRSAFAPAPHARNDMCDPSLRAKQSNPVKSRKNSAFTLAEIMIVLTVIGVLTAILLPAARQVTPDENVMKFKKAHNTLYSIVRELVTSDKYYLDGDLGVKPNGSKVDSPVYFCRSFADLLNTKKVACSSDTSDDTHINVDWVSYTLDMLKKTADDKCASHLSVGEEIITADDVVFYNPNSMYYFGHSAFYQIVDDNNGLGFLAGSYEVYKIICIDVDGMNKGEAPFGYGIRVDGKILNGLRAEQWLTKSIQGDE